MFRSFEGKEIRMKKVKMDKINGVYNQTRH